MPDKKEYMDPKYLSDGKVLNQLKKMFLESRSKEALTPLLACLRDAYVLVPQESDTIKQGDDLYFPMFSTTDDVPDVADEFTMQKRSVVSCICVALTREDLKGLILDPFSEHLIIAPELAEIILKLPSLMKQEEESTASI